MMKFRLILLTLSLAIISGILATPPWPSPYWDIPGDYCASKYPRMRCCQGRKDPCNVPILGTLCYCDTFCNRTENADCCPDYFTHCEGLNDLQFAVGRPEEVIRPTSCPNGGTPITNTEDPICVIDGKTYRPRDKFKQNCNSCRCESSPSTPGCMEVLCETQLCLLDESAVRQLESTPYLSWKPARNYSSFWGKTLDEGLSMKLGTFKPEQPTSDMSAIKFYYTESELPSSFDSRRKWPDKISGVPDQSFCGASWAFSTASVASDRFAIEDQFDGGSLSAQALISCNSQGQSGCRGGHVDRAWNYLRRFGTVPENCYPFEDYDGYENPSGKSGSSCKIPRSTRHRFKELVNSLGRNCPPLRNRRSLFRTQPAYRVGRRNTANYPRRRENDIMYEILTHGPVQALMEVPRDFFLYRSGVYKPNPVGSDGPKGFHSVRIIGWGEELGMKYWLCSNSWGTEWGEEGLFRIERGVNSCQIEEFVVGVWAQSRRRRSSDEKSNNVRRRRRLRMAAFNRRKAELMKKKNKNN